MTIRVTCPGCHKRFNVSAKFAGKEGPCPNCKKKIKIPAVEDEVVIHAPESKGPKDATGESSLKPITRQETAVSGVQWTLISVTIIGFFAASVIIRLMISDPSGFPLLLLGLGAVLIAVPTVLGGYAFLRDQELGRFVGRALTLRVAVCSGLYAVLWSIFPLMKYAFDGYQLGAWIVAVVAMIAVGAAVGMLSLDLDYLVSIIHFGLYFGCCLVARLIVGIGVLPGMNDSGAEANSTTISGIWPFLQTSLSSVLSV